MTRINKQLALFRAGFVALSLAPAVATETAAAFCSKETANKLHFIAAGVALIFGAPAGALVLADRRDEKNQKLHDAWLAEKFPKTDMPPRPENWAIPNTPRLTATRPSNPSVSVSADTSCQRREEILRMANSIYTWPPSGPT
jgi:hypothetical protein